MASDPRQLMLCSPEQVPAALRWQTYFALTADTFGHATLLRDSPSVIHAVRGIRRYAEKWLATLPQAAVGELAGCLSRGRFTAAVDAAASCQPAVVRAPTDGSSIRRLTVAAGAQVLGAYIYLDDGDVYIGPDAVVEPGAGIRGPTIVGARSVVRQGAHLRQGCVVGDDCTLGGEAKNAVFMNQAMFPHPSYVGDSLCGYRSHFGNQATAANLGIYEGLRAGDYRPQVVNCGTERYDIGTAKLGLVLGDYCQVGCNAVTDPGTFLAPRTVVYALTRVNRGFYGPNEILKNKPMEHGVIERTPLTEISR